MSCGSYSFFFFFFLTTKKLPTKWGDNPWKFITTSLGTKPEQNNWLNVGKFCDMCLVLDEDDGWGVRFSSVRFHLLYTLSWHLWITFYTFDMRIKVILLYVKLHNLSINFKDLKLFSFFAFVSYVCIKILYGRVGFLTYFWWLYMTGIVGWCYTF